MEVSNYEHNESESEIKGTGYVPFDEAAAAGSEEEESSGDE